MSIPTIMLVEGIPAPSALNGVISTKTALVMMLVVLLFIVILCCILSTVSTAVE